MVRTALLADLVWQLAVVGAGERNNCALGRIFFMIRSMTKGATTTCYATALMRNKVH